MRHALAAVVLGTVIFGMSDGSVATRRAGPQGTVTQVVKLRLAIGGREIAIISTPNATMATLSTDGGEGLGLTPVVKGDRVELTVAVEDPSTREFTVVGRHMLERHKPVEVGTGRTPLEVEWVDAAQVSISAAGAALSMAPCSTCCVVCGGRSICACEVSTDCGYCCCKETCGCSGEGAGQPRVGRVGAG